MSSHFRFDIVGADPIAVNVPDKAALMEQVAGHFGERRGFALATINLDHLVKLQTSPSFREAYGAQDMVIADGNPIVWLSRLAQRPVALAPGSDLVVPAGPAGGRARDQGSAARARPNRCSRPQRMC